MTTIMPMTTMTKAEEEEEEDLISVQIETPPQQEEKEEEVTVVVPVVDLFALVPHEVLQYIFSFVNHYDLCMTVPLVCSEWYDLAMDHMEWGRRCLKFVVHEPVLMKLIDIRRWAEQQSPAAPMDISVPLLSSLLSKLTLNRLISCLSNANSLFVPPGVEKNESRKSHRELISQQLSDSEREDLEYRLNVRALKQLSFRLHAQELPSTFKEVRDRTHITVTKVGQQQQDIVLEFTKTTVVLYADDQSLQSNNPFNKELDVSYFEMHIDEDPQSLHEGSNVRSAIRVTPVAIGISSSSFRSNRQPGWERCSCGYHADDGKLFVERDTGHDRGWPTFSKGDTVGCGFWARTREIFFTLNGQFIGVGCRIAEDNHQELYPTVGMWNRAKVSVNFGVAKPFLFDLASLPANQGEWFGKATTIVITSPQYAYST